MEQFTHGIRGTILRGAYTSANGGISERVEEVTLVGPNVPAIAPVSDRAPAVEVGETLPGYTVLRPVAAVDGATHTGYMASGAYVAPSYGDNLAAWRKLFGHHGALPLHDRSETWEQYRALCD